MIYMGIDNGISGGFGVVNSEKRLISFGLIPTSKVGKETEIDLLKLKEIIKMFGVTFVALEQGQKQPRFGCKGNYSAGYSYGRVSGMLETIQMPRVFLNPKTWQPVIFKDMRGYVSGGKNDTKSLSIEYVKRQFAHESIKNHNITDGICIAAYCAR